MCVSWGKPLVATLGAAKSNVVSRYGSATQRRCQPFRVVVGASRMVPPSDKEMYTGGLLGLGQFWAS